jgi:hypothetical protein
MPDDPERADPKGTMDTVPPPKGAKDAYSAQTRVGTLPEHVLAAMREQEASDAAVLSRTRGGMRAAMRSTLAPPPLPTSVEAPALEAPPEPLPPRALPFFPGSPPGIAFAPSPRRLTPLLTTPVSLVHSLLVVAAFALLGALVAVAIVFAGS